MRSPDARFQPEIEGLRGVAILLVLLAHAGVPGFSGGFVGVDMFFVISGYLITRLLEEELESSGRVNFMAFYARRVKRLMPAFTVMLTLVGATCQWLMPLPLQDEQAKSGYWASLWASNLGFAMGGVEYFDDSARRNVFLHTWSLGVEEQFYLVWPLLLFLGSRYVPSRLSNWVAGIACASFLLCVWMASRDAHAAYYLMPTRLWQLAAGAWVGMLQFRRNAWPILGCAIIALMLATIGGDTPYPSAWALLPVVAAALLLRIDADRHPVLSGLVAGRPFRFLGRVSYSLYLWHWPALVFCRLWLPEAGWRAVALALVASIALATASERWVERPFRHAKWPDEGVVGTGLLLSLLLASMMAVWQWSAPPHMTSGRAVAADPIAGQISLPQIYRVPGFDEYYQSDRFIPVLAVSPEAPPTRTVLLAGDSILMQWEPAIAEIAHDRGWSLVAATKSSCPVVDASYVNERIKRRFVECERWRDSLVTHILTIKPGILIIGSASTYPFNDATWVDGTRSFLGRLEGAPGRIVIVAPPPRMPFNPMDCVRLHAKRKAEGLVVDGCNTPLTQAAQDRIARLLVEATRGMPHVKVLRLDEIVCPGGECRSVREGQLVFRDEHHMNADFVQRRSRELSRLLEREGIL